MKTLLALIILSTSAYASACTYQLDHNDYSHNASGVLTYKGTKYRCDTIVVGHDFVTLCKKPGKKNQYAFTIGFDGGEAGFAVANGIFDPQVICSGNAKLGRTPERDIQ